MGIEEEERHPPPATAGAPSPLRTPPGFAPAMIQAEAMAAPMRMRPDFGWVFTRAASHAMADAHASERRNSVQSPVTMASYSSLCVRDSAYSHGDKSSKLKSSRIQG